MASLMLPLTLQVDDDETAIPGRPSWCCGLPKWQKPRLP